MKRSDVYALLLAGSLLVAGCKKDHRMMVPQENQPLTVQVNESARIASQVTLNVNSIEDSRCPSTTTCIWYGQANVKFTLQDAVWTQTGELCIGQCNQQLKTQDAVILQLGTSTYEVVLTAVRPYPGGNDNTTPEAVLQVIRR